MKKKLLSLLFLAVPFLTFAQEKGLDQQIDEVFGNLTGWFVDIVFYQIPFTDTISIYWVLFPLILGALYFTFYFNFINFKGFFTSINIVRGKYDELEGRQDHKVEIEKSKFTDEEDNPDTIRVEGHEGEVSHFQALTTALSGTVGTGNIAGVAFAIYLGGPAALLWMLMTAILGMTTKFVEVNQENGEELGFDWIVTPFGFGSNYFLGGGTVGSGTARTNQDFIGTVDRVTFSCAVKAAGFARIRSANSVFGM